MYRSRPTRLVALSALALAVAAAGGLPAHATPGTHPATPIPTAHSDKRDARGTSPAEARLKDQRQAVFVQLSGEGAADVASRAGSAQAAERSSQVERAADSTFASAKRRDKGAVKLFTVSNAIPGVGMRVSPAGLAALHANPNVVKVSRLTPKTATNSNVASLVRAVNTWKFGGNTGKGVKVGIIDTGLDFTHADFGGVGTSEAYDAADADSANPDWRTTLPALGKAKVLGGYDFVGNAYDGDTVDVPTPDANPLDCNGHGTHVAGSAAGYGVTDAGDTFTGDYAGLNGSELLSMDVGPGMAPDAKLYGLKVFGCEGSTDYVIPALDWALDPNGDGDFRDHLDIVNMSLGSTYGPADDPENDVVNKLAAHGVLSVTSAGNNGDLTDTGGTPGNAVSTLAVASSVDALQQRDGIRVNAPGSVAGVAAGQMSIAYDWPNNGPTGSPVTGDVAAIPGAANADGCDPLSPTEAAAVAGKVAWLIWDDNDATRRCGSVGRSGNVKAAGAIGAIFTSSLDVFSGGITGDAQIPVFQLPKAGTTRLQPAVDAGTLNVTFDGALQATIKDLTPGISDMLSSFSSRGVHGSFGVVKPDVAAVGDTVSSANVGTGNEVLSISGTSMAAPVTAGVAALVQSRHRRWSPLQVKAAVMNTAGHDVWTGENKTGHRYAPARVGAGRIDARSASSTKVLAWTRGRNNPVSASFGVVPAPIDGGVLTQTKKVVVANYGKKKTKVALRYQAVNPSPGVSYSVSPRRVKVKKNRKKVVTVTMRVVPTSLRHRIDPTMESEQLDTARQFVSDSSGRLLVKPKRRSALRVPVYGAAKPVSTTTATYSDGAVQLSGTGIDQGFGSTGYASITSVMELGATSDELPTCEGEPEPGCVSSGTEKAGDIQHVGAGSSGNWLWFGVSTWADWSQVGTVTIPYVDYDVDGDDVPDYETFLQTIPDTDLLYAYTIDLTTFDLVDLEPVNFNDGNRDTNVFDTNVVMLPVWKGALELLPGGESAPISYTVGVYNAVRQADTDTTESITFDAGTPAVSTDEPLYLDEGGAEISVNRSGEEPAQALVFHLHGASGQRAEVLDLP